ncbi:MAG: exodeoxyribonuclease small subunit [Thermoleophilia bacterium]|nr:exodeoxyribonuclease small subunit [Thermoleophilia bacterium]
MANDTTANEQQQVPVEQLSFEQAQAELEQVVEALEDRHTGLDQALALWERGEQLHKWCQTRLDYAAERLQKLSVTADDVASVTAESGDAFAPSGAVPAPTTPVDPAPVAPAPVVPATADPVAADPAPAMANPADGETIF